MKKKSDQEPTAPSKTEPKRVEYNVQIGNHLYERVEKHMFRLKHLKSFESKADWVQEAIQESLALNESSEEYTGDRYMHLKLDQGVWVELDKKVESLRSSRRSVSKKAFIEEAIFKKLDREENESKKMLKKLLDLSSEE